MMPANLREALLTYCLDEIEAGVSLEEILHAYPDQADEIRPTLEMAVLLSSLPGEPAPAPKAQVRSRDQFLAQAQSLQREKQAPRPAGKWWRRLSLAFGLFLLIILCSSLFSLGTNASLPGELLYPFKRGVETIQLALASPEEIGPLEHLFRDRRTTEIIILMETGKTANVQGEGYIEEMDDGVWTVYGIKMQITPDTEITGDPQVGRIVQVEGTVRDGKYFARTITIVDEDSAVEP